MTGKSHPSCYLHLSPAIFGPIPPHSSHFSSLSAYPTQCFPYEKRSLSFLINVCPVRRILRLSRKRLCILTFIRKYHLFFFLFVYSVLASVFFVFLFFEIQTFLSSVNERMKEGGLFATGGSGCHTEGVQCSESPA